MMDRSDEKTKELVVSPHGDPHVDEDPLADTEKSFWERSWPTFACGAGLWSDGYLQYVSDLFSSNLSLEVQSH